jgi:DNA mismatch repair protein MutL
LDSVSKTILESVDNQPIVRRLDTHTINQIAAGEVVERPASVVKELVENAIDAGASRIDVDLVDAGRTMIRVRDNGIGMTSEDAQLALERHATSKIRNADDLLQVSSLGFRGEALPSIASVSRFTLTTGVGDGIRHRFEVDGSELLGPVTTSGPRGTEISVEELFYSVPARRKFLKTDTTELGQILDHMSRYAFAYPDVAFRVTHNEQLAMDSPGRGDESEAISSVWSREVAKALIPINTLAGDLRIRGWISPPHMTRPTRAYQFLYVNRRPVRSRNLVVAVDVALRDITPERRYPYLVLHLETDPSRVDINVSPNKSEVRFQTEGYVFDSIRMAIKSALLEHGMMPTADQIATVNEALRAATTSSPVLPEFQNRMPASGFTTFSPSSEAIQWNTADNVSEPTAMSDFPSLPMSATAIPADSPSATALSELPFASLLDGLRVIGQALNTFIVAETRGGIVLIDQHVAHERIIYEHLCGIRGQSPIEKQILLVPQTLELDRRAATLLGERMEEIRAVGFDLDAFGTESFVVRAVPAAIRSKDPIRLLRDMVDELVESSVQRRLMPTREQIWITCSCKMAVKAGDPLSRAEMEKLITDLALTENPYLCPHGRPITVTLSSDALYRLFKRT